MIINVDECVISVSYVIEVEFFETSETKFVYDDHRTYLKFCDSIEDAKKFSEDHKNAILKVLEPISTLHVAALRRVNIEYTDTYNNSLITDNMHPEQSISISRVVDRPVHVSDFTQLLEVASDTHEIELDKKGICGMVKPKRDNLNGDYDYLSTHTFDPETREVYTRILRRNGFNIIIGKDLSSLSSTKNDIISNKPNRAINTEGLPKVAICGHGAVGIGAQSVRDIHERVLQSHRELGTGIVVKTLDELRLNDCLDVCYYTPKSESVVPNRQDFKNVARGKKSRK